MKTVKASHFKAHFGAVLDEAEKKPVRIARRGRPAAVLISEEDYEHLTHKVTRSDTSQKARAFEALIKTAAQNTTEFSDQNLRASVKDDPRGQAIVDKYLAERS